MGLTLYVVVMLCVSPAWLKVDAATKQIDGGGFINLGNRERTWVPHMNNSAHFSEVESVTSHFSFRSYDPEGLILYGDSNDGEDWFLLSLRRGIPEMQFGKPGMRVTVWGGPKLNDGIWHKLELRSEDEFVALKVDGKPELRMRLYHDAPDAGMEGSIHLAIGGMLIDPKKLPLPINPLLDACIRDGRWLDLSTPWDVAPRKMERPCSPHIKPGSFFSGSGLAVFNTSALPAFDSEKRMNITVHASSDKWNGTILSMWSYHTNSRLVTVGEDTEEQKLFYEVDLGGIATEDLFTKDFKSFQLTIEKDAITFASRVQSDGFLQSKTTVHGIVEQWEEGMLLAFGGRLGEGGEYLGSEYMEGCLDTIFVQGQKLDLDQALFKDESVSSHSCPV